jgi:hypothetical protein
MTAKVRRELMGLRALAKTRRAAAWKAHRDRLLSGHPAAKPKAKAPKG